MACDSDHLVCGWLSTLQRFPARRMGRRSQKYPRWPSLSLFPFVCLSLLVLRITRPLLVGLMPMVVLWVGQAILVAILLGMLGLNLEHEFAVQSASRVIPSFVFGIRSLRRHRVCSERNSTRCASQSCGGPRCGSRGQRSSWRGLR